MKNHNKEKTKAQTMRNTVKDLIQYLVTHRILNLYLMSDKKQFRKDIQAYFTQN